MVPIELWPMNNKSPVSPRGAAGKATDNQSLKSEGVAQERKGEGPNLKGKLKRIVGGKI